jgi:hypothetical protein
MRCTRWSTFYSQALLFAVFSFAFRGSLAKNLSRACLGKTLPFSLESQVVLLEFEVRRKQLWNVITAKPGTHDNLLSLSNQCHYGSFKRFPHSTHLLSVLIHFFFSWPNDRCTDVPMSFSPARIQNPAQAVVARHRHQTRYP